MEIDQFKQLREELHRYPELSGNESETSKRLRKFFHKIPSATLHTDIGGYGFIADFRFPQAGPTLLFRADIDAVAVQETLPLPYCSCHAGVSHKCGHDGHAAILAAFADLLHRSPFSQGRILLLYQPAEETGQGAREVLDHPFFKENTIDAAFALHNLPGFPRSAVVCRAGSFTCSVISCTIQIQGKTAHAAEPEKAIAPTNVLLNIWQTADSWNHNVLTSSDYFRTTLVELHIGEKAFGVAAGSGYIRLTFRAATEANLQQHVRRLEQITQELIQPIPGLTYTIEWVEAFAANENNPGAVEIIRQAARKHHFTYLETDHPFAWGEDFGLFTQHFPGAMFGLGAGTAMAALHTPGYDFPDEVIESGAQMFYEIAHQILCGGMSIQHFVL